MGFNSGFKGLIKYKIVVFDEVYILFYFNINEFLVVI